MAADGSGAALPLTLCVALPTMAVYSRATIDSQAQAHTIGSLGDIPMLVLTSGVFLREAPPGSPDAARIHLLWQEMHRELMRQSSNAQQILVETSGHFIQREQPEVIVAAIRQMVETVQH